MRHVPSSSKVKLLRAREMSSGSRQPFFRDIQHIIRDLNVDQIIHTQTVGFPTCSSLESQERRYLLTGDSFGTLNVFDLHCREPKLVASSKGKKKSHKLGISTGLWYPHDQGIVVSGSSDGTLNIWDSNRIKPVDTIDLREPVISADMSPCRAATKPLVTVCTKSSNIKLVNMQTGASVHHLRGHSDTPYAAIWSKCDPNFVLSAGDDGQSMGWDVRNCREPVKRLVFPRPLGPIHGAAFSTDSLLISLAHTGGFVNVFDGLTLDHKFTLGPLPVNQYGYKNTGFVSHVIHRDHLFFPMLAKVAIFDLTSVGSQRALVKTGHFKPVTSIIVDPLTFDMYTTSVDGSVLWWNTITRKADVDESLDEDSWSDEGE